ncbi:MAG: WG repeat-containing protein [Clostridia bacterium]|nr:WG repeat-containing protein [Clostridia bacterium]
MKRTLKIWTCVLAFFLFCVPAHASIAVSGAYAALISEEGEVIVKPGQYADIECVMEDKLYAARDPDTGRYLLMNEKGEALTQALYSSFDILKDGRILCLKSGKYGVLDPELHEIVAFEYTWIVPNGEGEYLALRTDIWDDYADGLYRIDNTGYVSPTGVKVSSFLSDFENGLSPALSAENGRYGYLNADGQWKIRAQYAYAGSFENDYAVATLDSGSGVIDTAGNWKITPRYDFIDIGNGEIILAVDYRDGVTAYDRNTFEIRFTLDYELYGAYVSSGGSRLFVYAPEFVCVIDNDGREIMRLNKDGFVIQGENGNLIVCETNGEYETAYLADENGNPLSEEYLNISPIFTFDGTGYYSVCRFKDRIEHTILTGVIDDTGKEVIPLSDAELSVPKDGYVLLENDHGMELYALDNTLIWAYEY